MSTILELDEDYFETRFAKVEYRLAQASLVWSILMFCNSGPEAGVRSWVRPGSTAIGSASGSSVIWKND
jgi:hypothetical protein